MTADEELMEAISHIEQLESTIDQMLDLVLGDDRPEWSSAYGYGQALVDVEERMVALEKAPNTVPADVARKALEALERSANYMKCTEAVFSQGRMYLDMTLMPTLSKASEASIQELRTALGDTK